MENSSQFEKFNSAFNRLDDVVCERLNMSKNDRYNGFKNAIKQGKKNGDKLISNYFERLDTINELRNFVTHESKNNEPIASPNNSIIEEMNAIADKIQHPKKVKDLFLSSVICFYYNDKLSDVLRVVKDKRYSQFPVFKDGYLLGLITENGITNYLANIIEEDIISLEETSLAEILKNDEETHYFDVIYENKSIYDIEELFNQQIKKGNTTFILLITKKANNMVASTKDIVGIITPWDLPILMNNK